MKQVYAEIEVAARPEDAMRMFTAVEAMRQWWGVDRGLVEEREGGPRIDTSDQTCYILGYC